MIKSLSTQEMAAELAEDENSSFTYSGAMALAEFLEEIEDPNNPSEFDRVAIRCDFFRMGKFARMGA